MATGPNWAGLDKGMLVQGSAAVAAGTVYKLGSVPQSVTPATAALTATDVGVIAIEDIDAAKVATGKVFAGMRFTGIAAVRVGTANLAKGTRVTSNASGQVVAQVTAGGPVLGVLLEAGGAVGTLTEMLLTPGATL